MQRSTFRGAVVGTSVGLIAFGSVASAAFLASGELATRVTAGTVQSMEVFATAEEDLFPGYLSDVEITLTNTNSVPTRITSVDFKQFAGDPQLTPYLLAEKKLVLNGVNAQGLARPLELQPDESITLTLPDVVGLKAAAPNAFGGKSVQGAQAQVIYTVSYTASPGTESARLEGGATS